MDRALHIAQMLQGVYADIAGETYPRDFPKVTQTSMEVLNNRAVSFLDLGKAEQSVALWNEILDEAPDELGVRFNVNLHAWRQGEITDAKFLDPLREQATKAEGGWLPGYLLAQGFMESGDYQGSIDLLKPLTQTDNYVREVGFALAVALSDDEKFVLSASADKTLKVWGAETGNCFRTLAGHGESVTSLILKPDGELAVSGSADQTLKAWLVNSGECIQTFRGHKGAVNAVAISSNGQYALSAGEDGTIRLWDVQSGLCQKTITCGPEPVGALAVSDTEAIALSASASTISVWNMQTGKRVRVLRGHKSDVCSICLSEDGDYVLSASSVGTMKVWHRASGQCLRSLMGQAPIALSRDGSCALSSGGEGRLRLWSMHCQSPHYLAPYVLYNSGYREQSSVAASDKADSP